MEYISIKLRNYINFVCEAKRSLLLVSDGEYSSGTVITLLAQTFVCDLLKIVLLCLWE